MQSVDNADDDGEESNRRMSDEEGEDTHCTIRDGRENEGLRER